MADCRAVAGRSGPASSLASDGGFSLSEVGAARSAQRRLLEELIDTCARLGMLAEDAAWWCARGAEGTAGAGDALRFLAVCGAEQTRSEATRWRATRDDRRLGVCVVGLDGLLGRLDDALQRLADPSVARSRAELQHLAEWLSGQASQLRGHSVLTVAAAIRARGADPDAEQLPGVQRRHR